MLLDTFYQQLQEEKLILQYFDIEYEGNRPIIITPREEIKKYIDFKFLRIHFLWASLKSEGNHIKDKKIKVFQELKDGSKSEKNIEMRTYI